MLTARRACDLTASRATADPAIFHHAMSPVTLRSTRAAPSTQDHDASFYTPNEESL